MRFIIKTAIIFGLLVCAASASAQDIIIKTDGTKIDAKVEKITETAIEYRKASNPTGPIYTVNLASVASIKYENGSVDTFNPSTAAASSATTGGSVSDDELRRLASSLDNNATNPALQPGNTNDVDLLKLNRNLNLDFSRTPAELYASAKKYRKTAWIGGGIFLGLGILSAACFDNDSGDGVNVGIGAAALGLGWWIGFYLRARSLEKKARELEMYSASIMESEILRVGKSSLNVGLNVMGNQQIHTRGLGLALSYNF